MSKISVFQLKITISVEETNSTADRPCKLRYLRHDILGSCERPRQRGLRNTQVPTRDVNVGRTFIQADDTTQILGLACVNHILRKPRMKSVSNVWQLVYNK